jgi:hypothetical protein
VSSQSLYDYTNEIVYLRIFHFLKQHIKYENQLGKSFSTKQKVPKFFKYADCDSFLLLHKELHKLSGLKQHVFMISQFLWHKSLGMAQLEAWWMGVGWEEIFSKPIQIGGR